MKLHCLLAACCCTLFFVLDLRAQQTEAAPQRPGAKTRDAVEYLARTRTGAAPFSEAVRVGQILYLSGQLGVDGSGALVTGGIKAETKQALENIRSILERNSSGMDQVVKCTVMLADIADRGAMSEVYITFFPKDRRPARSTFGTTGLALGAKVEIECMATLK
ncbi:MAG TPA: RidA family protein [Pyrinomonadaceae bacterium]|nr:RidA family protein [Pyrinomonadaceae bacterium]